MFEIKGLWTGRAGDPDPKPVVKSEGKPRFFYKTESDVTQTIKSVVYVYADGVKILAEFQDFKPGDGIDTGFFDVPESLASGVKKILIEIYEWTTDPAKKTFLYKSPEFQINF